METDTHFDEATLPNHEENQPCFEHGHWYLDDDHCLYIVPDDRHGLAETYGPDDDMLDALNAIYRAHDQKLVDWFDAVDRDAIAAGLGLFVVPDWQKRFDTQCGYFTA